MSTDTKNIQVRGIRVEVVRKDIKNLHLGVYPPHGRVRVAAPLAVSDDAVRLAVIGKLAWIRRQRDKFEKQPRQAEREAVTGESHYLFGRRYRLKIVKSEGRPSIEIRNKTHIEMRSPVSMGTEQRLALLDRWYRNQLREAAAPLVDKWSSYLNLSLDFWGFKRMKTKWGSCNHIARRIWLNSELAKKPIECLEYMVVHELIHLIEPLHGERFVSLMDAHLPDWRRRKELLNASPLAHEDWTY